MSTSVPCGQQSKFEEDLGSYDSTLLLSKSKAERCAGIACLNDTRQPVILVLDRSSCFNASIRPTDEIDPATLVLCRSSRLSCKTDSLPMSPTTLVLCRSSDVSDVMKDNSSIVPVM